MMSGARGAVEIVDAEITVEMFEEWLCRRLGDSIKVHLAHAPLLGDNRERAWRCDQFYKLFDKAMGSDKSVSLSVPNFILVDMRAVKEAQPRLVGVLIERRENEAPLITLLNPFGNGTGDNITLEFPPFSMLQCAKQGQVWFEFLAPLVSLIDIGLRRIKNSVTQSSEVGVPLPRSCVVVCQPHRIRHKRSACLLLPGMVMGVLQGKLVVVNDALLSELSSDYYSFSGRIASEAAEPVHGSAAAAASEASGATSSAPASASVTQRLEASKALLNIVTRNFQGAEDYQSSASLLHLSLSKPEEKERQRRLYESGIRGDREQQGASFTQGKGQYEGMSLHHALAFAAAELGNIKALSLFLMSHTHRLEIVQVLLNRRFLEEKLKSIDRKSQSILSAANIADALVSVIGATLKCQLQGLAFPGEEVLEPVRATVNEIYSRLTRARDDVTRAIMEMGQIEEMPDFDGKAAAIAAVKEKRERAEQTAELIEQELESKAARFPELLFELFAQREKEKNKGEAKEGVCGQKYRFYLQERKLLSEVYLANAGMDGIEQQYIWRIYASLCAELFRIRIFESEYIRERDYDPLDKILKGAQKANAALEEMEKVLAHLQSEGFFKEVSLNAVKALVLLADFDVNQRDSLQNTLLHIASAHCHPDVVITLLACGASGLLHNADGHTAQEVLIQQPHSGPRAACFGAFGRMWHLDMEIPQADPSVNVLIVLPDPLGGCQLEVVRDADRRTMLHIAIAQRDSASAYVLMQCDPARTLMSAIAIDNSTPQNPREYTPLDIFLDKLLSANFDDIDPIMSKILYEQTVVAQAKIDETSRLPVSEGASQDERRLLESTKHILMKKRETFQQDARQLERRVQAQYQTLTGQPFVLLRPDCDVRVSELLGNESDGWGRRLSLFFQDMRQQLSSSARDFRVAEANEAEFRFLCIAHMRAEITEKLFEAWAARDELALFILKRASKCRLSMTGRNELFGVGLNAGMLGEGGLGELGRNLARKITGEGRFAGGVRQLLDRPESLVLLARRQLEADAGQVVTRPESIALKKERDEKLAAQKREKAAQAQTAAAQERERKEREDKLAAQAQTAAAQLRSADLERQVEALKAQLQGRNGADARPASPSRSSQTFFASDQTAAAARSVRSAAEEDIKLQSMDRV